ncbi:MAG: DUF1292 domain-containing protein [Lachnospiraceae bacterium]|nr:DUF1292 domain-containing protein [Lachnospiraceae bacterium]
MDPKTLSEFENTEEEMTVTLNLDDGDVECMIVTIFEVNKRDYIVLLPLDENGKPNEEGTIWFYRYSENPDDTNDEPILDYIEDDEEYEAVEDRFQEFLDDAEFDEII